MLLQNHAKGQHSIKPLDEITALGIIHGKGSIAYNSATVPSHVKLTEMFPV